ncbi:hypothetical protein [Streptomyces sp. NPDC050263]|uniref:hypothetical protein n=1 Tax=Streptomyces sp. NPDC050263 TaxID=3155037 RepID=UPI00341FCE2E
MGLLSWLTRSGERGTRAGADAGTTPPGPDAATDAQVTGGWRSTSPVQRTLSAPMGLLTDPRGFGQRLGTWQDPTVTGPLGHLVSAQAPSGVGHGLAELTMPVQRRSIRPEMQAQAQASAWVGEPEGAPAVASESGGRSADPHDPVGPVVSRSVSQARGTAQRLDHAPTPTATVPLPQAPLQRTTVPLTGPAPDTAPLAPMTVMRMRSVPAAPAGPAPARPLNVAESPAVPAWELAAVPSPVPDADPGPLAPGTPDEPVADLLAAPGTRAGQDAQGDVVQRDVVQRTEAPGTEGTARPTPVRETAALPLAAPRPATAAGQAPDAAPGDAPTAALIGGADGVAPAVPPVVQRDVAVDPPRPRHRGLGEPLSALPPTALPLPGQAAAQSAVPPSAPSVPSVAQVSRAVEVPETPAAADPPTVLDLVAGPAEPGVSSSDGEGTAPLLGDTPPLTTDPVDLGTGLSPETPTGVGAEAVEVGPLPPALGAGPGLSSVTGPGFGSGSGTAPGSGFSFSSGFGLGSGPGSGPGSALDAVSGPAAGSGGAAVPGPVAVQRLDVPGGPPHALPSTDATSMPAEADRAPLLGDAGPLAVNDTVVLEAPGPGELVTASTPMPLRRLDAVDEATFAGGAPETGGGAGVPARGAGPVFPLVAQRSLPLYTVPESALSAEAPVASEPAAAVPVRWERVGSGTSDLRAGGSGGRAWSADTAAGGFGESGGYGDHGDHGGPRGGGHTATGGGSAYPGVAPGHVGGVVQRVAAAGAAVLADGAPSARSYGEADRPGFPALSGPPEFPGGSGAGAVLPDGVHQPSTRAFQGPGDLGPAVPLQRLGAERGVAPPPLHQSAPPTPLSPPPRGQAASASMAPEASAGAAAVAAGVARWTADGSVEFTGPAVQRAEDGAQGAEPPVDPPAPPEPVDPPGQSVGADGSSTSAAAPGSAGGAGVTKVTDELVRALLAPLSRLLRAELRIERERAGTLINTRH